MMFQRLFLSLLVMFPFLLLSGNAAAAPAIVTYEVKLNIHAGGPNQTPPVSVPSKLMCQVNGHPGCMRFAVDQIGAINFFLPGNQAPDRRTCTNLPAGLRQVITKIELSTKPRQNNPNVGVFGGTVDEWLKKTAFSGVDTSNGVVYEAGLEEALNSVWLFNENKHSAADGIKSFWYQVTVTDCDHPSRIWVFDPRGDNEGTN